MKRTHVMHRWLWAGATSAALCAVVASAQSGAPQSSTAQQFEEAVTLVDSRGDCATAVPTFERVASSTDRALAARALVYLGSCYERLGNEKARQAYLRVIDQFPDQRSAATQARARLAALDRRNPETTGLTLRPLWNKRPGFGWAGPPSIDGRTLPLRGENNALVLSDILLTSHRPPIPLGTATDGLSACQLYERLVLSPDARQAAYNCEVGKDRYELRVIRTDLNPAKQRRLLDSAVEPLQWRMADAILVQRRTGVKPDLAIVRVDTGDVRSIVSLSAPVSSASMSPGGEWVAFDAPDSAVPGRHDIMVVSSRGGVPVPLTAGPSDNLLPSWTPNGRGVLFVSDRTGSPGLWVQSLMNGQPNGTPQLLAQDLGRVMDVWAATTAGEFIYFRQTGLVKVGTAAVRPDGTAAPPSIAVTRQWGGTMMPAWSADGGRLAYQTTLTGTRSIALGIRDLHSGDERIIPVPVYFVYPRWSPDARNVVVRGRDEQGRYGLFLVDVSTGKVSALKIMPRDDEDQLGAYQWAPDGSLLLVVGRACEALDLKTGQSTQIWSPAEGWIGNFAVRQRDGAIGWVNERKDASVLLVREPDGTVREVLRAGSDEVFADVDWTPDGNALIFTRVPMAHGLTGQARWPSLWRIDVKTLTSQVMGLSVEGLRDIAVNPNGNEVAFTTGSPTREPWILEHYLPAMYTTADKR